MRRSTREKDGRGLARESFLADESPDIFKRNAELFGNIDDFDEEGCVVPIKPLVASKANANGAKVKRRAKGKRAQAQQSNIDEKRRLQELAMFFAEVDDVELDEVEQSAIGNIDEMHLSKRKSVEPVASKDEKKSTVVATRRKVTVSPSPIEEPPATLPEQSVEPPKRTSSRSSKASKASARLNKHSSSSKKRTMSSRSTSSPVRFASPNASLLSARTMSTRHSSRRSVGSEFSVASCSARTSEGVSPFDLYTVSDSTLRTNLDDESSNSFDLTAEHRGSPKLNWSQKRQRAK